MKLTCAQMDILLSFYLEGELSPALKKQIEDHLSSCKECASKYAMVEAMVGSIKKSVSNFNPEGNQFTNVEQYGNFKTNLSAYMDNELTNDESIKIKKITISNPKAKKDLQDSYNIRRLMKESLKKTEADFKKDFSKNIIKQIQPDEDINLNFNPAIKLLVTFTLTVLILTTVILISLGS